jgi:hypothetical protein
MTATATKNSKPILEKTLEDFYRQNTAVIKKTMDLIENTSSIPEPKRKNCKERKLRKGNSFVRIENLITHESFKGRNWEFLPIERENLRIIRYVNTADAPSIYEGLDFACMCEDISTSHIQGETSIHESSVVAGCISGFRDAYEKNESIYKSNIQNAEDVLDNKITTAQNCLGTKILLEKANDIKIDIKTYIGENNVKLRAKNDEINDLETEIEYLERIMKPPITKPQDTVSPFEEPSVGKEIMKAVGLSFTSIVTPFLLLGKKVVKSGKGFFHWLGEHCQTFSRFIRKVAMQPAFWIALLFAVINAPFFHRLFDEMFTDALMILILTLLCTSGFSILPFPLSKDIKRCGENPDSAIKARLTFESLLASLLAIVYPILTSQYSHIYAEAEHAQFVAATAVGLLPTITACVIGFINYFRLKGDGETSNISTAEVNNHE